MGNIFHRGGKSYILLPNDKESLYEGAYIYVRKGKTSLCKAARIYVKKREKSRYERACIYVRKREESRYEGACIYVRKGKTSRYESPCGCIGKENPLLFRREGGRGLRAGWPYVSGGRPEGGDEGPASGRRRGYFPKRLLYCEGVRPYISAK